MSESGVPCDASAIIYLAKAGGLAAAGARFGPLLMPPAVWDEVVAAGTRQGRSEIAVVERAQGGGQGRRAAFDRALGGRARKVRARFGLGGGESQGLALGREHGLGLIVDPH